MALIRAFIGFSLPPHINDQLEQEVLSLRQRIPERQQDQLRWISPQHRHVTLQFLGSIDKQMCLNYWQQLISHAHFQTQPSLCHFDQTGLFPDAKSTILALYESRPAQATAALQPYKKAIADTFAHALPTQHRKAFRPHITLARIRKQQRIDIAPNKVNYNITFDRLGLFESRLSANGSEYHLLDEYRF